MSRRFRYYAVPEDVAGSDTGAVVVRMETGQDYDTFASVQDGRWVPDNAAYEYVQTGQAQQCEREEARRLLAERYGPEEAARLVPEPSA